MLIVCSENVAVHCTETRLIRRRPSCVIPRLRCLWPRRHVHATFTLFWLTEEVSCIVDNVAIEFTTSRTNFRCHTKAENRNNAQFVDFFAASIEPLTLYGGTVTSETAEESKVSSFFSVQVQSSSMRHPSLILCYHRCCCCCC